MDDTVQKISDLLHEAGELAFLPGRELVVETGILEHDAEALADFHRMPRDVEAVELERARRRT